MQVKKTKVRKKMSMRDYATFANFVNTGERYIDLSDCDPLALDQVETRLMYLIDEQKGELKNFIKDVVVGLNAKLIIDSIPKIKRSI